MNQTNGQHDLEAGCYVVGVFDVLGQRSRLREPEHLEAAAQAVQLFRQLFREQFDERRTTLEQEVSGMPAPLRDACETSLAWNLVDWGMSDTWCVAVHLEAGSGAAGATAAMAGIRRLLEAAASTWFFSMSREIPIRGGVEIGRAVRMRQGDVYGPAPVAAHHLESEVAGGPRIVVGEQLGACLRDVRREQDVDYQHAAGFAGHCCSLLRRDPSDWRAVVDVLGSWAQPAGPSHRESLREDFNRAYDFVRDELLRHEEAGYQKLAARYRALLAYFDERAPTW